MDQSTQRQRACQQNRNIKKGVPPNGKATEAKRATNLAAGQDDGRADGPAHGRRPKTTNKRPPLKKANQTDLSQTEEANMVAGQRQYDEALRLARDADRTGDTLPVALLQKAATTGYPPAVYALANWHLHGKGVRRNYKKAVSLLTEAANKRYAPAEYDLAVAYELGKGVAKSPRKAYRYYLQAAEDGSLEAQGEVARCCYYGLGTKKDLACAVQWYTKAADRGDPDAQFALGIAYEHGDGVEKNSDAANYWYKKAGRQGVRQGRQTS